MNTKSMIITCAALLFACTGAVASDRAGFERMPSGTYAQLLGDAGHAYDRKDYNKAFPRIQRAACAGDKTSQVLLGRMYILGQGTEKNDLKGYAWITAAAEYRFPRFTSLAGRLEQALTAEQRSKGNTLADSYKQHYGLVATQMDCQGSARPGAKIVDRVICTPQTAGGLDVWVHRCEGGKAEP